jgi:hypothetical protein
VVGINAKEGSDAFAIPVDFALQVLQSLKKKRNFSRVPFYRESKEE